MIKNIKCTRCGRTIYVEIDQKVVQEASNSPSGVTALTFPHGDHVTIVYIDRNGDVRSIQWALLPTKPVAEMIREIPVPAKKSPSSSKLNREEWMFLALCKEERDLREIATLMNEPYPRIRLLAEKLRAKGYLERIDIRF